MEYSNIEDDEFYNCESEQEKSMNIRDTFRKLRKSSNISTFRPIRPQCKENIAH